MFAHTNRTCCWPAPTISLQSRNAISNENRSATVERISATVADTSVQKKATHPLGSSTNTTRIAPPTGRHIATNVLYRFFARLPYKSKMLVVQPRRCPARLAKSMRVSP